MSCGLKMLSNYACMLILFSIPFIAGPLSEPMKISRIFSMYNSGVTPLTLYLVGVGAGGREEGGFTVVNYNREIIIKPNKTKSIEIS